MLAIVLATAALSPSAQADPLDPSTPSSSEVQAAKDRADAAMTDVERVQQELDEAAAEVDAASVEAAMAAEAYNGARWKAAESRKAERRAVRKSVRAERAREVQKASYRDAVITGSTSGLQITAISALITADGMESLIDRSAALDHVQGMLDQQRDAYTAAAAAADEAATEAKEAADKADAALQEARVARDAADAAADAATATAARIEERKLRLVRKLARLQGISVKLARSRQHALEAERESARVAAATPAAVPVAGPTPAQEADDDSPPAPDPAPSKPEPEPKPAPEEDDPPASDPGGARAAIAYARDQIGEPYVWGADGPGSWDCSGLTSKAWAAGGKYLPHYSVAQYEQSTPISVAQLRPGDLVFWSDNGSPGSIFHVALYTGSGQIIHAPRTGRPVTEESMYYWRLPDFYARP